MIRQDPWFSSIFGYPVYRLLLSVDETTHSFREKIGAYKNQIVSFEHCLLFTQLPSDRLDLFRSCVEQRFQLVEVRLLLEWKGEKKISSVTFPSIQVSQAEPRDYDAILAVAESSFVYTRFHADPEVPHTIANKIKKEWVRSYCLGEKGEKLLVARWNGHVSGFLCVLSRVEKQSKTRVLDLMAIKKDCQRKGIGQALVQSFLTDSQTCSHSQVVGTQLSNTPSLRLYEKCGFQIKESSFIMHAHWNSQRSLL